MDIIFDLDGTLANLEHRLHYITGKKQQWDAFSLACDKDSVIEPVANVFKILKKAGCRIIICSGRGDIAFDKTTKWLAYNSLTPDKIYMRPEGDYSCDTDLKERMYKQILKDGYKPELVFDDREKVVKKWRELGLICCQVAEGKF